MTAALSLPGVYVGAAHAAGAPEQGVIAFKYLHYQDSQPGLQRIKVDAPSVYVLAPLGSDWSVEGSAVVDTVSGATPRWQSTISTASTMHEQRTAGDVRVTRYFERSAYSIAASHSSEHDYVSNGVALEGSWSSDDNNTTLTLGVAGSSDRINPVNGGQADVSNETKKTVEAIAGLTQAISPSDLAQLNFTYSHGTGYFSDPYKTLDFRPRQRNQGAVLARWNHHFADEGSTLRLGYRFYRDSYRIDAHTVQLEWVKPLTAKLTVALLARYYSQSSASFYVDSKVDSAGFPVFPDVAPGQLNSGDQRLSAFGAVTLGLKAEYRLLSLWTVDGKFERYEQRSSWRLGGPGSTGLDPFRATFVQLGASRRF
ncbi:MAG: DUF3570 domain-containing protein [Rhizobacter sp.]|nr:DUF3570 domain-containing protein [Rhizobacter sp.]